MEDESREAYLLPGGGSDTPTPVGTTTQEEQQDTVMPSGSTSDQSDLSNLGGPSSGQQNQTVYLAMGSDGQALQIMQCVMQAPEQQIQGDSAVGQVVSAPGLVPGLGTVALPSLSIAGQSNPVFVAPSIPQSPILIMPQPVSSRSKGKKGARRNQQPAVRGPSLTSKQTVRSLLQQKNTAPPAPVETDLVPNVTVLSRDPTLSESLRLSATAGPTPDESSKKSASLLSLLTHKIIPQQPPIEVQGVAVQDLEKLISTQDAARKKPRILPARRPTGDAMRPLVPILPAPHTAGIGIGDAVLSVPTELHDAQELGKQGALLGISPDAQLLGLTDASQLMAQSGGLLPLSELEARQQLLTSSHLQFVQAVGSESVLASQQDTAASLHAVDPSSSLTVQDTIQTIDNNVVLSRRETEVTVDLPVEDATAQDTLQAVRHGSPLTVADDMETADSGSALPVQDTSQTVDNEPVLPLHDADSLLNHPEASSRNLAESQSVLDFSADESGYTAPGDATFITDEALVHPPTEVSDLAAGQPDKTTLASEEAVGSESDTTTPPIKSDQPKICQVFDNLKATLSQVLLDAIPGTKAVRLQELAKDSNLDLSQDDSSQVFSVSGDLHDLVTMHRKCLDLLDQAGDDPPNCGHLGSEKKPETCDKEITCSLLKPQFSRSGRQVKWQTIDSHFDDVVMSPKERKQTKPPKAAKVQPKKSKQSLPREAKQKKKQPDLLQKVMNSLLQDAAKDVEEDKQPKKSDTDTDTDQSGLVKTEKVDQEGNTDEASAAAAASAGDEEEDDDEGAKDTIPKTEDKELPTEATSSSGGGKDSEKENEEAQGSSSEDIRTKAASTAGQKLKSAEGLQLGRKKRKRDYEKDSPFKYFCNKCSFKTKRISHFEKHKNYHRDEVPLLKCIKCDFTTIRRSHLTKHQQEHSKVKYECPVCKYKSDSKTLLTRHYKAKHREASKGKDLTLFSCPHCSYKTLRLYLYNRHLKCHLSAKDEDCEKLTTTYQCELCPYKTQRKEHYYRHMSNVHEEKRPHLCDLCGKAFKRKDALKQHRVMHLDKGNRKYPFQCPECLKSFAAKGHLKDHMTIHTNVRAYLCEICGASFKTSSVQRKHVQTIHKNPRRFPCSKCEKRFNTKYSLRRHLTTHNTPGMRALQNTESMDNVMMAETEPGEVAGVLEQFVQDDAGQKIHLIQPQQIIEVGSVIEQSAESVIDAAGQQVVITSTAEGLPGIATIEEAYEQVAVDGSAQHAFIQPSEPTTLYYLTNFHSY